MEKNFKQKNFFYCSSGGITPPPELHSIWPLKQAQPSTGYIDETITDWSSLKEEILNYFAQGLHCRIKNMAPYFKQNLEHNISQSLCILSTVRLYHCLAFPVTENGKSFHLKVSSDMLAIRKHAQVCSNSRRWEYGFASPFFRRIVPKSCL
jgi:hypothetical protein